MATGNCTIGGVRARCKDAQGNGPYWFCANGGNYSAAVTDSSTWGVNNGASFYSGNINPCISATSGNNKYTVCIKVTTPNLSNVTISSLTISCTLFNHSNSGSTGASNYPLYASLRTTSASDNNDTVSTWRSYSIGSEASTTTVTGNENNTTVWEPTFYGSFSPNTSYYLFLYTKSTNIIYGAYMNAPICNGATVEYTQNVVSYTVTLSKDSGISSVSGGGTYTSGTSVSISATPADGYKFKNWTGYGTSTSNPLTFTIGQNRTYTANSERLTYTVTYNKGTYGSETNTSATKTHGTSLTLSGAIFTRSGYTQTGWASDADGTTLAYDLNGSYTTESSITLYPYWKRNTYVLTINPNGGAIINGSLMTSDDADVWSTSSFAINFAYNVKTFIGNLTPEGKYHYAHRPKKTGYTFTQYTFSPGGTGQINTTGDKFYFNGGFPENNNNYASTTETYVFNGDYVGNVTATANYTANTYYVQYNANGGSGSMNDSTHIYDTTSNLTKNTFTRAGYSFSGWNTSEDGSGTSYADQASVLNLTSTNKGTVILYAQWSEGTYSVSFNLNGGSYSTGDFSTMTCVVGETYSLPTGTLSKNKYTFQGWDTSSAATRVVYSNGASITDIASAGDAITLYAVWKAKTLTLVYYSNDDQNLSITQECDFSNDPTYATFPTSWTRSGYTAVGWGESTTKTSYLFGQAITSDMGYADEDTVILYCIWSEKNPWTLSVINIYIPDKGWVAF